MAIRAFERTRSEILLGTPIFQLRRDHAVNPRTGKEGAYYVLENPDWVNLIALTKASADGVASMILVRQFRHGTRRLELELPAGMVEPGEAPEHAAARELLEETGYRAASTRILGYADPNPAYQQNRCYHVLAEGCRKVAEPKLDAGEDIDIELIDPATIKELLASGSLRNACGMSALFFWFESKINTP
jgi:8-oxo-dGTP pyrophosphatase MutT (NUDIX family)